MEDVNKEVQIKYSSYTPAQKRATQKYRENNKVKVNEQRKKYYQNRKERDPEFLEYKRKKAKEYYAIKKMNKIHQPETVGTAPVEIETSQPETVVPEKMDIDIIQPETVAPEKMDIEPNVIKIETPATLYSDQNKPVRVKIIKKKITYDV